MRPAHEAQGGGTTAAAPRRRGREAHTQGGGRTKPENVSKPRQGLYDRHPPARKIDIIFLKIVIDYYLSFS